MGITMVKQLVPKNSTVNYRKLQQESSESTQYLLHQISPASTLHTGQGNTKSNRQKFTTSLKGVISSYPPMSIGYLPGMVYCVW